MNSASIFGGNAELVDADKKMNLADAFGEMQNWWMQTWMVVDLNIMSWPKVPTFGM